MDEVDVDTVGPEPLETRLDRIPDVAARGAHAVDVLRGPK